MVNGAIYPLPFDLLDDFEPVALLATNPKLVISKKAIPLKNLKELVAWLKANQDKVSAGTAGVRRGVRMSAALYLQSVTGTKFTFVPYRGAGPALQDMVAGKIDLMFDQAANSLPQVRNGNIRAYAVTAKTRLSSAPDIPTVDEAGMPGFYISVWHGLWLPKGTPKDIVMRLNAAVREALADPVVRQRLVELGRICRRRTSRRRRRCTPTTRPRSRSGGRSSRPRASRWSEARMKTMAGCECAAVARDRGARRRTTIRTGRSR